MSGHYDEERGWVPGTPPEPDEIPDEPIEYRAVYDRGGDVILNIGEGRWEIGGWCGDWRAAWRLFGPLRFALPGPIVGSGRKKLIEQGRRQVLDEILSHDDGGHDWSVPDVVLLARGGEQAVDEANNPTEKPGADG